MKASSTVLCNNILFRANKDKLKVTPMKLQKIMYYVCRDYVRSTGELPVSEQFEVWPYGPVLPSVYNEFKGFKDKPITSYACDALGKAAMVKESVNPELSRILDDVWHKYKRKTGIELSKMTHQDSSGWYKAYSEGRSVVELEDMKNDTSG